MTWLSDVLTAAKEIAAEDTITRYGDRPFLNADFIRNEFTIYVRRAIRRALRKYPNLKKREIPHLTNETHRAMMSLIHYPQLRSYWENRLELVLESLFEFALVKITVFGMGERQKLLTYGMG